MKERHLEKGKKGGSRGGPARESTSRFVAATLAYEEGDREVPLVRARDVRDGLVNVLEDPYRTATEELLRDSVHEGSDQAATQSVVLLLFEFGLMSPMRNARPEWMRERMLDRHISELLLDWEHERVITGRTGALEYALVSTDAPERAAQRLTQLREQWEQLRARLPPALSGFRFRMTLSKVESKTWTLLELYAHGRAQLENSAWM